MVLYQVHSTYGHTHIKKENPTPSSNQNLKSFTMIQHPRSHQYHGYDFPLAQRLQQRDVILSVWRDATTMIKDVRGLHHPLGPTRIIRIHETIYWQKSIFATGYGKVSVGHTQWQSSGCWGPQDDFILGPCKKCLRRVTSIFEHKIRRFLIIS